jgi:hypothetical protein
MAEADRVFEYRTGFGMFALLGLLMLIACPLFLYVYVQSGMKDEFTNGRYFSLGPRWTIPWTTAGVGIVAGAFMFRSGFRPENRRGRVVLKDDRLTIDNPGSGAGRLTVRYAKVAGIEVTGGGRGKKLRITYPEGATVIAAASMPSASEFEDLCALLKERVAASPSAEISA